MLLKSTFTSGVVDQFSVSSQYYKSIYKRKKLMRALYWRSDAVSRIKLKQTYFLNFVLFKVINSSCF